MRGAALGEDESGGEPAAGAGESPRRPPQQNHRAVRFNPQSPAAHVVDDEDDGDAPRPGGDDDYSDDMEGYSDNEFDDSDL